MLEQARHLFVAPEVEPRKNWRAALPDFSLSDLVWVLLPEGAGVTKLLAEWRTAAGKLPVVALSDEPSEEQGLIALNSGVVGYCNGHAAPVVLRQVADTVLGGGVWVGQRLLQRLLAGVARVAAQKYAQPQLSAWAYGLTEREIEVARAVASGASNKEIASLLDITERTVKAHLGSVFDKLKLRDRLQLTLLVNGIAKR